MPCELPKPVYLPHSKGGLKLASSEGDGYSVFLEWDQAFPSVAGYEVIYNIYYSTLKKDVYIEGAKAVSLALDGYSEYILDLTPGDTYYFAVRAAEYDPAWYNASLFPDGFPGLKTYPEGVLLSDITDSDLNIPVSDIDQFPAMGIIQVGYELIEYVGKDVPTNSLIGMTRGFFSTNARFHQTDGYDGYVTHDPPLVKFWKGFEEGNRIIAQETVTFANPNHPFTYADGYRERTKDILMTDLGADEIAQGDFQAYDYTGYHRTDPGALLRGECIGTYYGGEQFCADGYGVGFQVRGLPLSEANNQRLEQLLEDIGTGEACVLVKRLWKGKTCSCFESGNENPQLRCPKCFGTGFVTGYDQFFNPRRSDGRILVRFGPTEDDVRTDDDGLESVLLPDCWTLPTPALHDRDFLIRFNLDGTEEYRYIILNVTRNRLLDSLSGRQVFKAQRLRKTHPIYMWRAIRSTATVPTTVTTGIGFIRGPNGTLLPHTHNIVINEGIVSLSQVNQTTSGSLTGDLGHNHPIINGVIQEVFGHTHTIVLP